MGNTLLSLHLGFPWNFPAIIIEFYKVQTTFSHFTWQIKSYLRGRTPSSLTCHYFGVEKENSHEIDDLVLKKKLEWREKQIRLVILYT